MKQVEELNAVFDASEAVHNAVSMIEQRKNEVDSGVVDGIQFTVPELRDVCRPIYPAETAFILGHSRNGKSFVTKKVLYEETMKIFGQKDYGKVNVIVTWEEPAEILAMSWLSKLTGISSTAMLKGEVSDTELHTLKNHAVIQVGQYPIYIIGMSAKRGADGRRNKVDLSMSGVDKCLDWIMNKQKLDIRVLSFDYLQRIPQTTGQKREMHILQCVDWIKDCGFWTGAAVFAATQAKQEVLKRPLPIPSLYDSEWSANAAQSGDVAYSVFMPKTVHPVGNHIDLPGYPQIEVTNDLQILSVLKQKGAPDSYLLPMQIRPDKLSWRMHNDYFLGPVASEFGHTFAGEQQYV